MRADLGNLQQTVSQCEEAEKEKARSKDDTINRLKQKFQVEYCQFVSKNN